MIIGMVFFLLMAIFNHFDFFYYMWVFALATVMSLMDAVVSYLNKANKKVILLEIAFALIWLLLFVTFVLI
ncbi:hypothetical protein [Sporosarcina sp. BI001-red]|uniref:hypothetical protein n=1 Tax=Sporosarcina sp. BI001-red TaxID=2282866 RepID=UPI0011C07022|nr:hypothetical protein [Sporosarcina sp. BI001-red]